MSATPITLDWSDELRLDDARTDRTHQEMVALMNATAHSTGAERLARFQELLAHTTEHFAQEERWMLAIGMTAEHCHFSQHQSVLAVMQEVERRTLAGEEGFIHSMLEALVEWLPMHAMSMDGAMINFIREQGYDTVSESFPQGAPASSTAAAAACSHHEAGASCGS